MKILWKPKLCTIKKMKRIFQIVYSIAILCVSSALAQENAANTQELKVFEGPVAIEQRKLAYPREAERIGREGWVELNFMVDTQGKAYEITVGDNIGGREFRREAIRHLRDTVFTPARRGDEIVDGSATMIYKFRMEGGAPGANGVFTSRYRQFVEQLEDSSQVRAAESLRQLEESRVTNVYEYAYLSLARFLYSQKYGTTIEQMRYLEEALKAGDDPNAENRYLGEQTTAVRRMLFQLQVQNAHYADALRTMEVMERNGDEEGVSLVQTAAAQLEELRNNDQRFTVQGQIDEDGSWFIRLLKGEFQFADVDGAVAELKLRCQGSFVFFEFDPENLYKLSTSAGICSLEVIGDPGSTFALVQQ